MNNKIIRRGCMILIVFAFTIIALPPTSSSAEIPETIVEVFYDNEDIIAVDPGENENNQSLVPLRSTLEPKGIIINFNPDKMLHDETTFTLYIGCNNIGSKKVSLNRGGKRSDMRLFFLNNPPVIVNGQTMVPENFIQEVLDSVQNKDQFFKKIAAADVVAENISKAPYNKQTGYTYYVLSIGPELGPSFDQARLYVLDRKLLDTITRIKYTPNGYYEFGLKSTMIEGKDVSNREKAVWLTQNKYTEEISMIASVYLDQGTTRNETYRRLLEKGIQEKDIKNFYLAPYSAGKLCWYVEAKFNNSTYYISFDFYTGEILQELNLPNNHE